MVIKFCKAKNYKLIRKVDVKIYLWVKCPGCGTMIYHKDILETMNVCPTCDYHMKMNANDRINSIIDKGTIKNINIPDTIKDPLKFKDKKKYIDKLKETKIKTKLDDAIMVASGEIGGNKAVVAVLDFNFMGGSMGTAVGEVLLQPQKRQLKIIFPL